MSQQNVEIVRQAYEAFERGHHGHAGFLQWIADWTEAFDEFAMEARDYVDLGDRLVVCAHQCATGADSVAPVERDFWFLHELRGKKIVLIGIYDTEFQALEAAGLSE